MYNILQGVLDWAMSEEANIQFGAEYREALGTLIQALQAVMRFH